MTSTLKDRPLREPCAAPASFTNFPLLPYDIQTTIINMGCRLRKLPTTPAASEGNPVVHLDTKTTKSLALVNKTFNAVVTRTLYQNLRITRPSTLRLLAATIYDRPELGRLVRSLHVGPTDPLPSDWLPSL